MSAGRKKSWREREPLLTLVYELVLREMHELNTTKVRPACEEVLMTDREKLLRALTRERKSDSLPWTNLVELYRTGNQKNKNVCRIIRIVDRHRLRTKADTETAISKILKSKTLAKRIVVRADGYKDGSIVIDNPETLRTIFHRAKNSFDKPEEYPHLRQRIEALNRAIERERQQPPVRIPEEFAP